MSSSVKVWIVLAVMATAVGMLFWVYGKSDTPEKYQRTFEKKYVHGDTAKRGQGDHYHGSRESEIRKYRGNRYSTY